MSATGTGTTIIGGKNISSLLPVFLNPGEFLVFTHNLGRAAFSVRVTEADPATPDFLGCDQLSLSFVGAPAGIHLFQTPNVLTVSNDGAVSRSFYIEAKWEEKSEELNLELQSSVLSESAILSSLNKVPNLPKTLLKAKDKLEKSLLKKGKK